MKKIILTLLITVSCITVSAQETISDLWKAMPDSIIPYFNSQLRTELVELHNMSSSSQTKNLLEGNSSVKGVSNRFLDIKLNNSVELQMMLLPVSDTTNIICMVKSYGCPTLESHIDFYSSSWQKITDRFSLPSTDDTQLMKQMLTYKPDTMSVEDYNDIEKLIEPVMVSATLYEKDNGLFISYSINAPLLTKDDKLRLETIKRQKIFKWTDKTFK